MRALPVRLSSARNPNPNREMAVTLDTKHGSASFGPIRADSRDTAEAMIAAARRRYDRIAPIYDVVESAMELAALGWRLDPRSAFRSG